MAEIKTSWSLDLSDIDNTLIDASYIADTLKAKKYFVHNIKNTRFRII
jgi:hypothetical protein